MILILAGCSRTVPCTDSTQTPNTAALPPESKPVETAQTVPPAVTAPGSRPAGVRKKRPPFVSHVEREPVVGSELREPIGDADRMAPPSRLGIEIPSGAEVQVRINHGLDTRTNRAGDGFHAILMRPVSVNGTTVLPAGTPFTGHVTTASDAGPSKSRAVIAVKLDSFRLRSQEYHIDTSIVSRGSSVHKGRSGLGAFIGSITGSGKEAVGAAENTATGATTKPRARIAPENPLIFKLKHSVAM